MIQSGKNTQLCKGGGIIILKKKPQEKFNGDVMNTTIKRRDLSQWIYDKTLSQVEKNKEISELDKKKLKYGIQVLVINITKITILLIISAIVNVFIEALIIWAAFALIRRCAFGIHSTNSFHCTIVTVGAFVGGALIAKYVQVPDVIIYSIYAFSFFSFLKYAPADTEARPLVGKKLRKKLKLKTIISFLILAIISFILNSFQLKILFAVAFLAEAISILPITYKIFNRRYGNYEYYRKNKREMC